jgi:putative spermidine/putrescine transport system permease protein
MTISRTTRIVLRVLFLVGMAFIYIPLAVIVINSFNADRTFSWPPQEWTTEWWQRMVENQGVRDALVSSIIVASIATLIAMFLGTLVAMALGRYRFFGRDSVSLLVILPIALPGIVTGIALNNVFTSYLGGLTFLSIVIGHATFCIVVVYNNALARLRRVGTGFEEASMDLGAAGFTTFRLVTFPQVRSALLAGALLAFGLSFDEIIVTTFTAPPNIQTLPIWIFNNLFRPNQAPIVNAVAAALVLVSILPVYLAQRLSGDAAGGGRI